MKKSVLFFVALVATTMFTAQAADLYLRGAVNGWNASADYKFATSDNVTYVLEKTFDLVGAFKFADASWGSLNFGKANEDAKIGTFAILNGSQTNLTPADSKTLHVTKITVNTSEATCTIEGSDGSLTISSWTVAGDSLLLGSTWNTADTNNDMELVGGAYVLEKKNLTLAARNYEYKFVANHAWGVKELPASGNKMLSISAAGTYNVTFTLNATGTEGDAVATAVGPVETKYFAKNNWGAVTDWTWKEMTKGEDSIYTLERVVFGGTGVNVNNKEDDASAKWFALEDILGDKIQEKDTVSLAFDLSDSTLTATLLGRPRVPVVTYDTLMYVAGNFTNWAVGMQALPYAVTLPKDSTLEFKQVRVVTKKQESGVVGKDTTWYGQTGDGFMTRESNTWTLDGANNVKLLTDAAGEYTFSLVGESFVVTFPEQPVPPCVDNFGLMVDGTYVPGVYNETSSEWTVLNQDLKVGQILSMYSYCGETSFAPKQGNYADYFDVTGDTMIVKEDAEYDFYIQLIEGNDKLWVVQRKTVVLPRITKAPVSWAGEYAITAMVNDSVAAVWTGVDAGQSRDSVKLTDGKLAAVDPIMVVVEEMNGGGYSVKVKGGTNDGKYITQAATPSYGNGMKFVDKPVRVDITMNGGLVDFYQTISSTQTVYLLYNKTKGKDGERFRFYKGNNYGGSNYMSLTLFGKPAPAKTYDTIYTIAGNFTGWAEGMQPMPYNVENVAVDSVLEYKVVRELITYLDSVEIQRDTTWLGQVGDGSMTRTSNAWKLDGQNNVKLTADREGTYTFSYNAADSVLTVAFPALPGYTYDTVYTIAGNFTGWAEGMQPMPYEVKNVAIDSILEYKVVRQLITYETGVEVRRDTTWLGQPNSEFMTRENNAWKLDGANNVKLQADEQGTYIFEFSKADSVLTVTFPEILPRLDSVNTIANIKACYKAKTLADNDSVVVKGYITKISVKPSNFAKYGSANIWITDTLGGKTDELELYNCYGLEKDTFVYFGPNYTKTGSAFIDVDTLIDRNGVRYVVGEYLESAGKFKYFSGTYELNQGCYLTRGGTAPQPAPKYYITGNAALVGELAWNPTALLMVDSTHTFMGMAANSYEMKITNGAWDPEGHSWGFGDLDTEASSDGLTEGENGNICFTVEIPNNVVVSFANGKITVTGDFKKGPGTALDALMINSQKNGKFIYNGQLIIRQNGVLYNAAGERLK